MSLKKVLSFGEILIRIQGISESFFKINDNEVHMYPGGSEANVAVTLAQLNIPTSYLTAMPDHILSDEIKTKLESFGIDISKIKKQGDRIGSYFLLSANGLSNGEVIYDRKYSSFSQLTSNDLDWEKILEDIDWFHFTALTPSLNENMVQICEQALQIASEKSIKISVDLNYRSRLWQYGKSPIEVMPKLVQYADVIMGNIWAANKMLGTSIDENLNRNTSKADYFEFSRKSAHEIFEKYPKCKHVSNTFRFMDNPKHNLFYGTYHTIDTDNISNTYETNEVVDRIGSGDAFMAGLIYGLIRDYDSQQIIDTATRTGFHKLAVAGDFGNGKISD